MKRETALQKVQAAANAFEARAKGAAVATLGHFSADAAAAVAGRLREALHWAQSTNEEELTGESDDLEGMGEGDYVSHHPVIAIAQTAMESAPHDELRAIGDHVMEFQVKPGADLFVTHQSLDDFVFPLAEKSTVVLVGDWGTGKDRAKRVMDIIRQVDPDHVIHLGDIYPSGTPEMARKHFLDVIAAHGPKRAKYWAMNGNHEMNAKGVGYFGTVLPALKQKASYFALQNAHWRLVAVDTAFRARDVDPRQLPWLNARLMKDDGARNLVLTHHQMFSAVDPRPAAEHQKLIAAMQPFVDKGRVFGWFWGHEHWMLSYAADKKFGGYLARAIGHGGKRVKNVEGKHNGKAPPVKVYWNRPHPTVPGRCLNGFAVLRFDGPELTLSYPDETSTMDLFVEIWPKLPH
ncbi:MAG TPA: metallophosphoesterase [Longimicrobium sp.]|nr:metallophosphoesterase [Longimicrobium sp.]